MDRDDLPDGGAAHIAATIRQLKVKTDGRLLVEALVPDFQGDLACVRVGAAAIAAHMAGPECVWGGLGSR